MNKSELVLTGLVTEPIGYMPLYLRLSTQRQIYCEELAHVNLEAGRSHDMPSESCRPGRTDSSSPSPKAWELTAQELIVSVPAQVQKINVPAPKQAGGGR